MGASRRQCPFHECKFEEALADMRSVLRRCTQYDEDEAQSYASEESRDYSQASSETFSPDIKRKPTENEYETVCMLVSDWDGAQQELERLTNENKYLFKQGRKLDRKRRAIQDQMNQLKENRHNREVQARAQDTKESENCDAPVQDAVRGVRGLLDLCHRKLRQVIEVSQSERNQCEAFEDECNKRIRTLETMLNKVSGAMEEHMNAAAIKSEECVEISKERNVLRQQVDAALRIIHQMRNENRDRAERLDREGDTRETLQDALVALQDEVDSLRSQRDAAAAASATGSRDAANSSMWQHDDMHFPLVFRKGRQMRRLMSGVRKKST